MIQRQCPLCSSELVPNRRPDPHPVPGIVQAASPAWRCSVCGGEFTVEQIRKGNRVRSAAIEHT